MNWKQTARRILNRMHLDITKNLEYDRLTAAIMKRSLNSGSNCIDVGAHSGEMLELMLQFAPNGEHWAFEPIPSMFLSLQKQYSDRVHLFPYALSDREEETEFHFVKNAPAYSGLRERAYATKSPDIEMITVQCKKLDDIIPLEKKIDLIKIDVEGAEFGVLKGGIKTLQTHQPDVIFEFGLGASEYYETQPIQIFELLNNVGMDIYTLKGFLRADKNLSYSSFQELYALGKEYYFIASKQYHI